LYRVWQLVWLAVVVPAWIQWRRASGVWGFSPHFSPWRQKSRRTMLLS
jgi:hypothetical protein